MVIALNYDYYVNISIYTWFAHENLESILNIHEYYKSHSLFSSFPKASPNLIDGLSFKLPML